MKKCEFCGKEFSNLGVHQRACKGKVDLKLPDLSNKEKSAPKVINPGVDVKLDQVITGINTLAGAVSKLVEMQTVKKQDVGETKESSEKKEPAYDSKKDETISESYTPPRYRQIVDEMLSEDFGIKVTDFEDRTEFQLDIIVPEKYSSIPKQERVKNDPDIRTKIIPRALGENGVREWCKLIRMNLNKYFTQQGVASPFSNITNN